MIPDRTRTRMRSDGTPNASQDARREPAIAIIGAACRLPGAGDLAQFATLLDEGRDAVTQVPAGRFTQSRFLHPRPGETGRAVHFRAGTIGDVAGFDAPGFGLSPREADEMDPQQRLLLMLARRCFEDAGWPEARVAGQPIGAYVGISTTDYADLRRQDNGSGDRFIMTGGALSIAANRLGHVFDLRGPAMSVDTACSSAMVALHEACEALRAGRIPAALVGGVNMLLSPSPFAGFWRAGMLGARGRCQAFGAGADGYVRSEGGVVLLLKPLEDALRDGDAVRGVILGSGVNGAGRTNGISLPSAEAQAELIESVLRRAGVAPEALGYFEAHGTGTPAGDPIEAGAIARATQSARRAAPLPIGSVKSNLGHTEAASGLVSVLKALLVLETGRIPATLHAEVPNPAIPFSDYRLEPASVARDFQGDVVGVNSFGFGGTNGCVLIGRAPAATSRPQRTPAAAPPLILSARDAGQLNTLAGAWEVLLAGQDRPRTAELIRGQARHRDLLPHRLVLRDQGAGFPALLAVHRSGETRAGLRAGIATTGTGIAFVFSGNGAQWAGMAAAEMRASPVFRDAITRADAALGPHLGWSVAAALHEGVTAQTLAATESAQPLLFAVQYAIVAALADQGITPAMCLGHSVGEVAAAQAAGLLSLNQAARLIAARSRAQAPTRGQGGMAALGASVSEARALIAQCTPPGEAPLEIAAINAPQALTIAGPAEALERLGEAAAARRFSWVPLDLDYAFHSLAMEPVSAGLLADLSRLRARIGRIPMISSVTGEALSPAGCTPAYWWRNLREPVRFEAAMRGAAALQPALFLEIGPNPVLRGYMRATLRALGQDIPLMASLSRRNAAEGQAAGLDPFPALADEATALGADPRGAAAFAGRARWRGLPPAPLSLQPHWFARSVEATGMHDAPQEGRLLGFRHIGSEAGAEWRRTLDTLEEPWLADHQLAGQAVLPAAAMLEMALEAGFLRHPETAAMEIIDFTILRALPVAEEVARELRCRLDEEGLFTLDARRRLGEEAWTRHAMGRLRPIGGMPHPVTAGFKPDAVWTEAAWNAGSDITALGAERGLDYGAAFRPVTRWRMDAAAGRAEILLERPEAAPEDAGFHVHPSRLDGGMQGLFALLAAIDGPPPEGEITPTLLPTRFERVVARRGGALAVSADLVMDYRGQRSAMASLSLRDSTGAAVAILTGAHFQRLARRRPGTEALAFHTEWRPAALPAAWPGTAHTLEIARLALPSPAEPPLDEAAALLGAHAVAAAHAAGLRMRGSDAPLAAALRRHAASLGLDSAELPAASAIWQQVLFEEPALAQELAVLAQAAEGLPAALAGRTVAPARLPARAESLRRLAGALAENAAALIADWPADRPCRVLVVGAEDGPLLPLLRRALAPLGVALRLTVTHVPGSLPAPLPAPFPGGLAAETVSWDPNSAEAPPVEADLVLGLALSLRCGAGLALGEALRGVTAPGGALLLAEPMPGLFWDMTEGLVAGWWDSPPLRDASGWLAMLKAAGWSRKASLALPAMPWAAAIIAASRPPGGQVLRAAPARRFALAAGPAQLPFAEALREALAAAGASVALLPPDPAPRSLQGATLVAFPAPEPGGLVTLTRLAATAQGAVTQFHIVVRDGCHEPHAAGQLALARVLANEMPTLRPHRHDIARRLSAEEAAQRLAAALLDPPDAEAEQRITFAGRLVPRLTPTAPVTEAPSGPCRLETAMPGQLDSLAWRAAPDLLRPLGEGEVMLRVRAAGLNFRDVMWAQNLLPEEALRPGFAGPGLGMEAAGIIEAVGPGVALRPGQAVFGFAPRALATRCITRAAGLAPLPRELGMVEAASMPVAFLTAIYALEELARLQPGERVLIHGGAGAVGLAALQVALSAGARIAATAGSPARRAFLRAAGAEIALDSRDGSFAEALRAHWGANLASDGEGCVDVCLNSLAGEAMERSLGLMAPFGRFLELGKRDFAEARRVTLRPLRRNIAWHAVDLDEMARHKPALAARLLASLAARQEAGRIRPLPTLRYEADAVEEAFRQMQAGGHIGKLVITPPAEIAETRRADWRPDAAAASPFLSGTVLVVGGVAGFGLEAACWLASQGVRHLALLSRSGAAAPGAGAAAGGAIARLAALGAMARVIAADATDATALGAALKMIRAEMPPLEGVVHAAAIFADGVATRLDDATAARVWAAKVTVADNLDRLTREDPLRLFLLFSSATVPIGSPGQAAYVAANAAMETMAWRRKAEGRPALAIQWGPIGDAGVLTRDAQSAVALSNRLGATALKAAEALGALPGLLATGRPVIGLGRVDWISGRRSLPLLAEPSFAALTGTGETPEIEREDVVRAIIEAGPEVGMDVARRIVAHEVARILRLPAGAVAADIPLPRLGLDSLGGIELRTGLERRFSLSIPLQGVSEELTVNALARRVLEQIPTGREAAE